MKEIQTSPYNESVSHQIKNIRLVDCTLRDGEQQPGIVFSKNDKVEIAKVLDRLGVYEIEAGMPAVSRDDFDAICEISSLNLNAKVSALARAKVEDINMVKDSGAWGLRISLPAGNLQRKYKLKKSEDEVIAMALKAAEMARASGLHVIFSPYDTARCDLPFLVRLLQKLCAEKLIDRIRIVDTVGSALPTAVRFLTSVMKTVTDDLPIEIHCHNDFGLALASTIEGVLSGCTYVSCTLNGLGPHSGNVALEEVTLVMETLYHINTGISLNYLNTAARTIEKISGITISPNKAVIGPNAFANEAGLTVAGILQNPFTGHAYKPEMVGQKLKILLGKKSGLPSVQHALYDIGVELSEDKQKLILQEIKQLSINKKRTLTDDEFLKIVNFHKNSSAS